MALIHLSFPLDTASADDDDGQWPESGNCIIINSRFTDMKFHAARTSFIWSPIEWLPLCRNLACAILNGSGHKFEVLQVKIM